MKERYIQLANTQLIKKEKLAKKSELNRKNALA